MSLKEQIAKDINVFFSLEDFAELHKFCGIDIVCIIDNEQLQENQFKAIGGLYEGTMLIYVKQIDLIGFDIDIDKHITFDNVEYIITNVSPIGEIVEITLNNNMGY